MDIENTIIQALQSTFSEEYLLDVNVSERAMVHRFAVHLEDKFPGYRVDCEYNRNHYVPKTLDGHKRYPDIIVHKRCTPDNLLVIEVKKSTVKDDAFVSEKEKLFEYKNQLGYKEAYLIILPVRESESKSNPSEYIEQI